MMQKLLLFFVLPLISVNVALASHVSGGEITYQYLDSNKYKVTLNLFRDCSGIPMDATQSIDITSSCNGLTVTAPLMNPGGTEVSQICPTLIGNSTCNNGTIPGMEKYTYETVVTLIPCSDWKISWTTCCRNTTINIPTSSGDGSYFEATLNNIVDSNNISPEFLTQPIPSVCINQSFTYNLAASNEDGDSLRYSFIAARSDSTSPLTYATPYSSANAINGITLNQATGEMSFTPTTLGNFIVVVQVEEYDENGILIGTVMRDIQIVVVDCSGAPQNVAANASQGTIQNLTGTATMINPYSLQLCSGGDFSFDIAVIDSNSADSVSLSSDILTQLPGATFTVSNGNPATATISYSDTGAFTGSKTFVIVANDNVCPTPGVRTYIYTVNVVKSTFASDNITICGSQEAELSAGGGSNFLWSTISGDSIVVGSNFSCNPCANPVASPGTTTTYVVTSDLTGSCTNMDTVTVTVVTDFSYVKSQTETGICKGDQVQFSVTASGAYTYQWSPSYLFDNDTISNPTVTFDTAGSKTVFFTITNSSGCSKTDNMSVLISPNTKPEIVIIADSTICSGGGEQLNVNFLSSSPAQITVGTGTSVGTSTSYPAPYGNYYMGVKHQILFKASELNALNFTGGQISSIALNVASINGTTVYNNFEIKMGTTTTSSLTAWQTGLVTVFPAQTINVTTGWNVHNFSTAYNWDGTSNLIVDICFNNQPSAYTNNSPTYYTTTPFTSVLYYNADNNPTVCSSPSFSSTSSNRPNIRFNTSGASQGEGFSYAWSPSFGLNSDTIKNPVVNISNDTTYTVIVTDTIGGCADTASISLDIVPGFTYTKSQDSAACRNEEVQFLITPSPGTYTYQWTSSGIINDSTIANPTVSFSDSGLQTVYVTLTSANGCDKTDSMTVLISPNAKPQISIIADSTICSGGNEQLNVSFGSGSSSGFSYAWTPVTGLSSSTISNPIVNISADTTYTVVVTDTAGGCSDTASISLAVVPGFSYTKAQADTAACKNEKIQFAITPSAGVYTYQWSPSVLFDNSTIANPIATMSNEGIQNVFVTITNDSGCDQTDSMSVTVSSNVKPEVSILADTTICSGGGEQLNLSFGSTTPSEIIVGTSTNIGSNTAYPAPYGNYYMGVKHQLLFTAAELNALNFTGGPISSLALNVASISGTTVYNNFEIKMGTTLVSSLTTWQTGLITVFPSQTINITAGWNVHNFSTSYTWDGTSNLVVEICFNNQPTAYTNNSPTYYTTTPFTSVIYFNADVNPTVCSSPTFSNTSSNRPNIKFSIQSAGSSANYIYSWSPSYGLNDSTIANPVVNISNDTTYTVIVTDSIGGCADTASINLSVVPGFTYTKAQADSSICLNQEIQFAVTPSPGTYNYEWTPGILFDDSTVSDPIAIFDEPGEQKVYVTLTSANGCSKTDSMTVMVSQNAKPQITINADTTICSGGTEQLFVSFGNDAPSEITVGTGTTAGTTTSYPSPYGNYYMGVKHQILFTAAELNAMNFNGGDINSIAFNIESISGTTSYQNFEIKMGSTVVSALSTWISGLVTVFPATTVNIATGWNVHNFSSPFTWDGISNLVVEVCFNNQPALYTNNSPTYYSTTSFTSVLYSNSDNNPTLCTSPPGNKHIIESSKHKVRN